MRKVIALFLTVIMITALVPTIPAFAEDNEDSFDRWNRALDNIPDDSFSGEHTVRENPDGSKTYVYENGSVSTEYADGTQEGVDYKGNQHFMDKDENVTVKFPDGTTFAKHTDGKVSYTETDGKTTTINPDQSTTETFSRTGIIKEYDSDGHLTGVGFAGSDERIPTDEYGDVQSGKVTGPDGRELEIKYTDDGVEAHLDYGNGKTLDYEEKGIADSNEGCTETYKISGSDEFNGSWSTNTKIIREDGVATGKSVTVIGQMTDADNGSIVEYAGNINYDTDGNPVSSDTNVVQLTGADGTTLWKDGNCEAWGYENPNNGEYVSVDKDGNLTKMNMGGKTFEAEYDESGEVKTAKLTAESGAEMIVNPDGSAKVILPDGTVYESDGKGNVYKNGEQIKKDGEWVEGYDPAEDTGEPDDTDEPDDEPNPPEPTETPDTDEGFTPTRVAGTYKVSGTSKYVFYNNPEYNGSEHMEVELIIKAEGKNMISMSIESEKYGPAELDPETGKCTIHGDDGLVIKLTFTQKGEKLSIKMTFNMPLEDGHTEGTFKGDKN